MQGGYFVGRQPVVDARRYVMGYELLFRAEADSQHASFGGDFDKASIQVIANAFARFGITGLLGPHFGLLNVTREVLLTDHVMALPREQIVLEILENQEFDDSLVARCRELRAEGFRLALDDYVVDDPREPYLDLVDLVKIDLPAIPKGQVRELVASLVGSGQQVLAEKVETEREFEACLRAGCELFQGYYFARPTTLSVQDSADDRKRLVRILSIIDSADTAELAEAVESQPDLALRLLRITNSAGVSGVEPISSLHGVIVRLGRTTLRRWVSILLMASVEGDPNRASFGRALHGARLLELLAERAQVECERGAAFLAGILRALAEATGEEMGELISGLDLDAAILDGLLRHEGTIAQLMTLSAAMQQGPGRPPPLRTIARGLGGVGLAPADLFEMDNLAYQWVHEMTAEMASD